MKTSNSSRHYLKIFATGLATILAAIILFNCFMDPYSIYETSKIDRTKTNRPVLIQHTRLWKAHQIRYGKAKAIILGNSRGEVGLDPDHPGWNFQPTYNLSLPGASIYELLRYFQHAHASNPLNQVVAGLDFFQFNAQIKVKPGFEEDRLAVDLNGHPQSAGIRDHLVALASLDALRDSIRTLTVRNKKAGYLRNGLYRIGMEHYNKSGSYRQNFLHNEKLLFNSIYNNYTFSLSGRKNSVFDYYRTLLVTAHRDGIDLRMLISPSHARQFELIAAKELWSTFEDWKRQLTQINEEEARKANKKPFPLWDFSGYTIYTTEKVPLLNDKETKMNWYQDSSHYKKELGNRVLDRIFGHSEPDRAIDEEFGVQISSDNIEQHLVWLRQGRELWRTTHPKDVAEIETLKK